LPNLTFLQSCNSAILQCSVLLAALLAAGAARAEAQAVPAPDDARSSMLRAAMLGLLPAQAPVPVTRAQHECLALPVDPPDDRLEGPHGDTLISTRCRVAAYDNVGGTSAARWSTARYEWTSVFTPDVGSPNRNTNETVTEEEAVLFEIVGSGMARPVWHARIETGDFGTWRSVTPEITETALGTELLSVMSCVNGTGGCGQEFLHRHADGRWFPVRQTWLDELPANYSGRIRHGVRIDPRTLRGEAGFYGDSDPNCCPSQVLIVDLMMRDDALVLRAAPRLEPGRIPGFQDCRIAGLQDCRIAELTFLQFCNSAM
jgi:hypothetical protein